MLRAFFGAAMILAIAASAALARGTAAFSDRDGFALASAPTPTGTPSSLMPPAPPYPLDIADITNELTIRWADNSDNEDGFKIEAKVCCSRKCTGPFRYTVGPNTTSFQIPPEFPPGMGSQPGWGFCNEAMFNVTAFNAAGRSETRGIGIFYDPPMTGEPPSAGGHNPTGLAALLFAGSLLLASGGLLHMMARSCSANRER